MNTNILKIREVILMGGFAYEIFYKSGYVKYYPFRKNFHRLPKTVKNFMYHCYEQKLIENTYRQVWLYQ